MGSKKMEGGGGSILRKAERLKAARRNDVYINIDIHTVGELRRCKQLLLQRRKMKLVENRLYFFRTPTFCMLASLSHDREPCEIKVVFNHTCLLHHTCVCAGSRRRRVRLSGFRRKGIASLLGVSQVTLFRSGSVPNTPSFKKKKDNRWIYARKYVKNAKMGRNDVSPFFWKLN